MNAPLTTAPGGLTFSSRLADRIRDGELTQQQADDFRDFLAEVDREFLHHRVITDNAYTRWFRDGTATDDELRHFLRQFSVFSNQFLVAALLKVINAPTLSKLYGTKVEVLRTSDGRLVVVGQPEAPHHHGHRHG